MNLSNLYSSNLYFVHELYYVIQPVSGVTRSVLYNPPILSYQLYVSSFIASIHSHKDIPSQSFSYPIDKNPSGKDPIGKCTYPYGTTHSSYRAYH
jgi:hypothetical protein|uniref:Uncharacterized protein n=1 Tax=Picea glauca TaxID=3330 RepID=A0A117NGB5_PICGL|nr:hypothetical protein ABT39_MTgene1635 [Picea glauca]